MEKRASQKIYAYQQWHGSHKFFFKGKVMAGPHVYRAVLVLILIYLLTASAIHYLVTTNTIEQLTSLRVLLPALLSLVCLLSTTYGWLCATFADPGTIPIPQNEWQAEYLDTSRECAYVNFQTGRLAQYKFCRTCCIVRPPRSVHCAVCDCCVLRLDHHCPWLGTCVGRRNYHHFMHFIVSIVVLAVLNSFNICFTYFNAGLSDSKELKNQDFNLSATVYPFTILALTIIGSAFPLVLTSYHTYLWMFR